jgi:CO/xanthine dehydrogenase FAD-binding subunit
VKLPPLDYIRPGTVTEALKVWSDREVMFLAGGQGLLSEMGQGLRRPATLADISAIPELGVIEITADGSMIRAGAAVRLGQLAGHPALRGSLLAAAARHVGVPPIRALATVGGNFCHGHPTAELPLAALVAGASLVGFRRDGTEARFTGPELAALRPAGDHSEVLLTALEWPVHGNGHAAGFAELGEQRSWVPAVAVAWLADHQATPAQPIPQARIGVALRGGGRFLVSRAEGIPCTAASVGQAAASPGSAPVETGLPASWLADLINELLGEDAEPERM